MEESVQRVSLKKPFDQIVVESIDEVLSAMGGTVKTLIYFYVNSELHLTKEQIPSRLGEFFGALEKILGVGAIHIERKIMQALQEKTQVAYPLMVVEYSLADFVVFVKHEYEDS